MRYSAVVNTFKRPTELVSRCLFKLIEQEIEPAEIILIDQNEEPIPLPVEITTNKLLRIERIRTSSVSVARNSIHYPDDAEYIFFCDDDGYPDPEFSTNLKKIISSNPSIDIFSGAVLCDDTGEYYTLRQKVKGSLSKFRNTKKLLGSALVVKKSVFIQLDKFSEDFGTGSYWGSSEETDFAWKVYFSEFKQEFFPELKVYHPPALNLSLKEEIKKTYRYGRGKGALVNKWLFRRGKLIVLYELAEMFVVPFFNSLRGLLTLKLKRTITPYSAFAGRLVGLLKAFFYKFS